MKLRNEWWCVRHGQAETNLRNILASPEEGLIFGLTPLGIEQAESSASQDSEWDVIISSPYLRARQTAEIFAARHSIPISLEERFEEINMGDLCGTSKKNYEDFITTQSLDFPFPNGESVEEAGKRSLVALLEWDKKYTGKKLLLVAHAIVLRALLANFHADIGVEDLPHATPFPLPLHR